jgi:predicted unusual protein kinase regulating ubiquinone biosynthesis (AarF/ABC1/UbiB family)
MRLSPAHLRRYKDIALLFLKYGRGDLARQIHEGDDELAAAGAEAGDASRQASDASPEHLAQDLERMGPTFVKVGQILSGRPDLLPARHRDALSRLQDKVTPFPVEEVEAILFQELGVRVSKAFAQFDRTPLAAASLGQVHRATMRDGREVVVKVQRPGIRAVIATDFEVLADVAALLDRHTEAGRLYHFAELVEQFRRTLRDELNYEREADHMRRIGRSLAEFPRLHVPQPVADFCSPLILTMEHAPGRKITRLGPLARIDLDGAGLADELLQAYLKQVLVDGLFHADPHPGNIFVTDQNHLALLDFGMVGRVTPALREQLLRLLMAINEGRGEEAAEVLAGMGSTETAREAADKQALARAVASVVARQPEADLQDRAVGRALLMLDHQARLHRLHPPPELSLLGKTLLQLDEVGRTLDPNFRPAESIKRHLGEIMTARIRSDLTRGNLFGTLLEAKNFAAGLPARLNRVMENLGRRDFELTVRSPETDEILAGMRKIANRISAGLVLAALIVGAALLMRVETEFRLWGYPGLAMVCFAAAAAGGGWLVIATFWSDSRDETRRRRG